MFQKITNPDEANTAKQPQAAQPSPAAASSQASAAPAGHRNRLSSDVEIKGGIRFQDELIIDGKVEGEITSTGALFIQENARIRAEIKVGSIVVQGKVHGNITATQTIELCAGSEVVGDIKAAVLTMETGAIFVGKSEVGAPSSQPAAKAAAPKGGTQPQKQTAKA